jgi:hypothetical protein
MAEKRRSALNRASQVRENASVSKSNGQGRFQGKAQFNPNTGTKNVVGKRLIKPCAYYNNNVCSKKNDHEEGNILYRHICTGCYASDHIVKECPFLRNTT